MNEETSRVVLLMKYVWAVWRCAILDYSQLTLMCICESEKAAQQFIDDNPTKWGRNRYTIERWLIKGE